MKAPEAVEVPEARDAAWAAGQAVSGLREAYFAVVAALDQLRAVTADSRHPLPLRTRRSWDSALALANRAEQAINAGVDHLNSEPGVHQEGSTAALVAARTGVDRAAATVERLRIQVERARTHLLEADHSTPATAAATDEWRVACERLDLLVARLHVGAAALTTYTQEINGGETRPGRVERLARLVPPAAVPAGALLAGARAGGRLVAAGSVRPVGPCGQLRAGAAWRRRRRPGVGEGERGGYAGGLVMSCYASAVFRLCQGHLNRYDWWLRSFERAGDLPGYAGYLAALFLLAVERRFRPGQDYAPVARCVATARDRFDPERTLFDPATALWLVDAALDAPPAGESDPPDPARLVATQTVLLVSLLVDEGPGRADLDALLAEAGRAAAAARHGGTAGAR